MYLGIDIGTSSVKAVLISDEQHIVASQSEPLQVSRPQAGWSEQDPDEWTEATGAAIDALERSHRSELARVRGIGLSGQMHGATLLDKADRPLRPAILWDDGRSAAEAAELDGDERFRTRTGNIVFPGFTAPKLVWVARHEPRCFDDVAKVLLPKDYVRLWLTGEYASDMSDASGTSWLDVARRDWDDDLLAATDLDRERMPALFEGTEATGKLRPLLASRWGMDQAPVVAAGAGDNAASACGVGTVAPGSAFISLGTSGVLFVSNAAFSPSPETAVHAFCHALPATWHQMGVILSAAGSLDWLSATLGADSAALLRPLEEMRGEPSSVLFLPYLSGERTPYNDAAARGAFLGVARSTGRTELVQAVIEGVAFAFADNLDALRRAGAKVDRATAVGGGSRSRAWLGILADVLQIEIDIPSDGDFGAAFGAARLGLIAANQADPLTVCTAPKSRATIHPDSRRGEAYAKSWARYRALYLHLKEAFSP